MTVLLLFFVTNEEKRGVLLCLDANNRGENASNRCKNRGLYAKMKLIVLLLMI